MKKNFAIVTVIIFIILSAVLYWLHISYPAYQYSVLMTGNILMAILALLSYFIVRRQVDQRPQAFVRGVYTASFLKLMVCMTALLVYVLVNKPNVHKPSVFILFGIYAVYTVSETMLLSRMARDVRQ